MWRWAQWVLTGFAVIVIVLGAWMAWAGHETGLRQRTRDEAYEQRVEQLRKDYPPGTTRGVVEKGLGLEPSEGQAVVVLGVDPGDGLVCRDWRTYIVLTFGAAGDHNSESLVSIRKVQGGTCL